MKLRARVLISRLINYISRNSWNFCLRRWWWTWKVFKSTDENWIAQSFNFTQWKHEKSKMFWTHLNCAVEEAVVLAGTVEKSLGVSQLMLLVWWRSKNIHREVSCHWRFVRRRHVRLEVRADSHFIVLSELSRRYRRRPFIDFYAWPLSSSADEMGRIKCGLASLSVRFGNANWNHWSVDKWPSHLNTSDFEVFDRWPNTKSPHEWVDTRQTHKHHRREFRWHRQNHHEQLRILVWTSFCSSHAWLSLRVDSSRML